MWAPGNRFFAACLLVTTLLLSCRCSDETPSPSFVALGESWAEPLLPHMESPSDAMIRLWKRAGETSTHREDAIPLRVRSYYLSIDAPTMPAPGRPRLAIPLRDGYPLPVPSTASDVSFDLLPADSNAVVSMNLGSVAVQIIQKENETELLLDGESATVTPRRKYMIHLRADRGRLCIDDTCVDVTTDETVSSTITSSSSFLLSNLQYWNEGNFTLVGFNDQPDVQVLPQSGSDIIAWERMAQGLALESINLYVTALLCARQSALPDVSCDEVQASALAVARGIIDRCMQWPEWRAYDQQLSRQERRASKDWTSWDRGSWANGYMPLAISLAAAYLQEQAVALPSNLSQVLDEKGFDYIEHESFPSIAHWIQRSTNHGQLMYGSAWAAALIADDCKDTPRVVSLRSKFIELSAAVFSDGGYRESPSYLGVFLMAGAYGLMQQASCDDLSVSEYVATALPELAKASVFVDAISDSSGNPVAEYGDHSRNHTWRSDLVELLSNAEPLRAALQMQSKDRELDLGEAYLRLRFDSGEAGFGKNLEPICTLFPATGVGVVKSGRANLFSTIAILGMPLHGTHNKDLDIGSISISRNGHRMLAEDLKEGGRSPWVHNAVGVAAADDLEPKLELCKGDACGPRKINGALAQLAPPIGCAFSSFAEGPYLLADETTLVAGYRRTLWVFEDETGTPIVLAIDRATDVSSRVVPQRYLNFALPASSVQVVGNQATIGGFGWLHTDGGDLSVLETAGGMRLVSKGSSAQSTMLGAWLMRLDGGETKNCAGSVALEPGKVSINLGPECWTTELNTSLDGLAVAITTTN